MAVRRPFTVTPHKSVAATTSTGPGSAINGVFTGAAVSVTRTSTGTVTVQLQGSIDGTNYINLGASQTAAVAGTTIYRSTGTFLVAYLRALVTANAAPGAATVWVVGTP